MKEVHCSLGLSEPQKPILVKAHVFSHEAYLFLRFPAAQERANYILLEAKDKLRWIHVTQFRLNKSHVSRTALKSKTWFSTS